MREASDFTGLVVEDEWLLRLELVEELRRAGWKIVEAATGEEALGLLSSGEHFDFLVTDIRLPGPVDGWQVAQSARARYPVLPVIYVSANPINEQRRVPDSIFLGKPCDVSALLRACDQMVRG
jgi:CheY-like chemotaxis protein